MKTKTIKTDSTLIAFILKIVVFVFAVLFVVGCSERDSRGSGVVVGDSGLDEQIVVQTESTTTTSTGTESSTTITENTGSDDSNTDSGDGDTNLDDGDSGSGGDGESLDGDSDAIVDDNESDAGIDNDGAVGDIGVKVPGGWEELTSPEFVRGGLVLLPEPPKPLELVHEIVDMCDDSVAFLLANGRNLAPGETPTAEELEQVWMERGASGVDCESEGGRRFVYVSTGWWTTRAHKSVADAARSIAERRIAEGLKSSVRGKLLGTFGMFNREFPLEERDEVVVLVDTVSVSDGVIRGLVHNLSEVFYARDVIVEVDGLSWWWPLTLQPGERAPFEITGWDHNTNPIEAGLTVTANMSTTVDLSRSFDMGENRWKPERDDRKVWMGGWLVTPTTPTGLDEQIQQLHINDLRSYFAVIDNATGTVIDVVQAPAEYELWHALEPSATYERWYEDSSIATLVYVEINTFPVKASDLPENHRFTPLYVNQEGRDFVHSFLNVENYKNYDLQYWLGGTNPPPTKQTPTNSQDTEDSS